MDIGGDGVARLQYDDIARDYLLGWNETHMTVAPHADGVRAQRAQSLNRACRLELGQETNERIDSQYHRDRAAFLKLPEVERQRRREAQQIDDWALELMQQQDKRAGLAPRHDCVRPKRLLPALGFLIGKAAGERDT